MFQRSDESRSCGLCTRRRARICSVKSYCLLILSSNPIFRRKLHYSLIQCKPDKINVLFVLYICSYEITHTIYNVYSIFLVYLNIIVSAGQEWRFHRRFVFSTLCAMIHPSSLFDPISILFSLCPSSLCLIIFFPYLFMPFTLSVSFQLLSSMFTPMLIEHIDKILSFPGV